MTKQRVPGSIEDAIDLAKGGLGVGTMSLTVGKTESLVRKWSDPDSDTLPSIRQCIQIDVAYARAGYGEGPVLATARRIYQSQVLSVDEVPRDVMGELMDIPTATGDLFQRLRDAVDVDSDGGVSLTPHEMTRALRGVEALRKELDQLEAAIRQHSIPLSETGGEDG